MEKLICQTPTPKELASTTRLQLHGATKISLLERMDWPAGCIKSVEVERLAGRQYDVFATQSARPGPGVLMTSSQTDLKPVLCLVRRAIAQWSGWMILAVDVALALLLEAEKIQAESAQTVDKVDNLENLSRDEVEAMLADELKSLDELLRGS